MSRIISGSSDIGMWSFDAMKIPVCGDGAMLNFNTPELRHKADRWFYFGLETKSGYENSVAQKWWEFDISCFGHKAIMNDMTAAVALEQLKKLPENLPEYIRSSYYFYHVQLNDGKRDEYARFLRENGIYINYRYFPLHRVLGYGATGEFANANYAADYASGS